MKCPSCGANIYEDVNRCQYCGAYQPARQQNVPPPVSAGSYAAQPQQTVIYNVIQSAPTSAPESQRFQSNNNISDKNKWVALALCFFAGVLGIHKFYVGKVGMGILYLFTFGIFGIGCLIDLICIVCGSSRDKWGRKLV